MFISFTIFLSLIILTSFIFFVISFDKKINLKLKKSKVNNWFIYITFVIAAIFIIISGSKLSWQSIYNFQNQEILKMSLLAYIVTNFFVCLFFGIIVVFAPVRIYYLTKMFLYKKHILKTFIHRYLFLGSIAIASCLIIYAFKNFNIIYFGNNFDQIKEFNSGMVSIYLTIKTTLSSLFKQDWTAWLYILYFVFCFVICWIYLKYFSKNHGPILYVRHFNVSNNISFFTVPMAFAALIITASLNALSLFARFGIFILIILLFSALCLIIKFIFKIKKKESTSQYLNGVIFPFFFIAYLAISNKNLFSSSILENINFWICLFVGGFVNGLMHFNKYQNVPLSRYNLSYIMPKVTSGINTSLLLYCGPLFTWYIKQLDKVL